MPAFTVLNPATEEPVAQIDQTSAEAADAAIARAVAAQAAWRSVPPGERAALLRAFADVIDAHIGELAALETAGSGHPAGQARWEAGNVRDVLLYYSAAPERLCRKQIPVLNAVQKKFANQLVVVGLTKSAAAELADFTEPKIGFASGVDTKGKLATAAGVTSVPCVMLVDPKGIVLYQGHPAALTEARLQEFLSRPSE